MVVWGPDHILETYARGDLEIEQYHMGNVESNAKADFAVVSSHNNKDLTLFPGAEVLWRADRDGAIFVVVKRLNQTGLPW